MVHVNFFEKIMVNLPREENASEILKQIMYINLINNFDIQNWNFYHIFVYFFFELNFTLNNMWVECSSVSNCWNKNTSKFDTVAINNGNVRYLVYVCYWKGRRNQIKNREICLESFTFHFPLPG